MRKLINRITANPIRNAVIGFVIATVVVVGISVEWSLESGHYGNSEFLKGILIEAHGMLLDILIIGVFILWLNRLGERHLEIQRYLEELEDFKGWRREEAMIRTVANIKRLSRRGVTVINLAGCYLANADLSGVDLQGADFTEGDLSKAQLKGAILSAYPNN